MRIACSIVVMLLVVTTVQCAEPKPDTMVVAGTGEQVVALRPLQAVMGSMVQYYRPQQLAVSDKRPEGLKAEPKYKSPKPLYGQLVLGDGPDNHITVVLDEPENGTPRIYIDRNHDKDLTNDGNGQWTEVNDATMSLSKVVIDVPYKTGTVPYTLEFYRFKSRLREFVLYYRNACREGEIHSGGKAYKIAALNENADGRFDNLENGTLLIDLNRDGKLEGRPDSAEFHKLNEPFNIHGRVWEVASMTPDGLKMVLRPSKAKVEMKAYLDPGCPAPPFAATGLDGKPIDLRKAAADSKLVLLDFWASWCGPCRGEFPAMKRLHDRYKSHGLRIVGVNLDEDRDQALAAVKEAGLDYPHAFDGKGWRNAAAVLYRVHGIPQTYLLDKDLKILAVDLRGEDLQSRVRELLGPGDEPTPDAAAPNGKAEGAKHALPSATLNDALAIYLGCGPVGGPGKIFQVDGRGKVLAQVDLPDTPYGLAMSKDGLVAALPGAGKVVSIDKRGKVETRVEGQPLRGADFRGRKPHHGRFARGGQQRRSAVARAHERGGETASDPANSRR